MMPRTYTKVSMETKICTFCKVNKPLNSNNFGWQKGTERWKSECKECTNFKARIKNKKISDSRKIVYEMMFGIINNDMKLCKKCLIVKPKTKEYFIFRIRDGKSYFEGPCKQCRSIANKIYRQEHKEEIKSKNKIYRENNKERLKIQKKIYVNNNRERVAARQHNWYEKNKKELSERQHIKNQQPEFTLYNSIKSKKYREENRESVNKQKNRWKKNKRSNDPKYKLHENISNLVRIELKRNKTSKQDRSIDDFFAANYFIDLKKHIETLFAHPDNLDVNGNVQMNWDNWGIYNQYKFTWHLDHIIPRSDLPYSSMEDDNFQKCWSLSNLRPLSAKQNLLDGANRTRHKKKDNNESK